MSEARSTKGVGARRLRKEDDKHLNGRGQFVDDIAKAGLMEAAFFRSPVAHARIRSISFPPQYAGRIFLASDLAEHVKPVRAQVKEPTYRVSNYPVLATGKVRMVGEPIAMCVAPTRAEAEDLCQEIEIEFEELPAVVDALEARKPDSPLVHEDWGDNILMKTSLDVGFDEAIKNADVVVRREYKLARQCIVPLEGKAALAHWDDLTDQLVLYASTQVPHVLRSGLSEFLNLEQRRVRVIAPDVGGGFGYKCVLHPEEICVAWYALMHRKPLRWTEDRREHLTAAANAREQHYVVAAYADKLGHLLAVDAEITVDVGAYSVWPFSSGLEAAQATGNLFGPYVLKGYRARSHSVATNKPAFMPYRGVSRPAACFATELTIDALAREIGREPYEVRMANLVPAEAMPYNTLTKKHYDSGDYPRSCQTASERIGLAEVRRRQSRGEADGRLIGVGLAIYTETGATGATVWANWAGIVPGFEQAALRLTPDGGLEIRVGIQSHGQGLETTLAQMANEFLAIDPANISVIHGDTAVSPYSVGTFASRTIVMAGGAVARSSQVLAARIKHIAAHLLQCQDGEVTLEDGIAHSPRGQISIREIAQTWYLKPQHLPDDVDIGGLEITSGYKPKVDTGTTSYATHAALVAVDPEIGTVEILDYIIAEDCGTQVNPMIVEGQAYGGAVQGIGTALFEEAIYDAAGQPLSSTLADYLLPGAADVPRIQLVHMCTPSPYTEVGAKGAGEGGAIAPPAAIICAINDALRPLRAEINETPATPRRIIQAILNARAGRSSV